MASPTRDEGSDKNRLCNWPSAGNRSYKEPRSRNQRCRDVAGGGERHYKGPRVDVPTFTVVGTGWREELRAFGSSPTKDVGEATTAIIGTLMVPSCPWMRVEKKNKGKAFLNNRPPT